MDRLDSMKVFLDVVETGSLSAASRKLGMPLATVSRKISELEEHLNVRLLIRSTRGLKLTEAGRGYVVSCERILNDINDAEKTVSGEFSSPKGKLVITAPTVFGRLYVLSIVADFLTMYPEIDIELKLTDRKMDLIAENIDVAIRIGELPDSSLIANRVGVVRRIVCGSPAYFKLKGVPETPKELIKHNCITIEGLSSPTSWIFQKKKFTISAPVHSRLIVSTVEAGLDAAIKGIGIIRVLSYQVAKFENEKKLKIILKDYETDALPVHLIHVAGRVVPNKLRAFLDYSSPRLRQKIN